MGGSRARDKPKAQIKDALGRAEHLLFSTRFDGDCIIFLNVLHCCMLTFIFFPKVELDTVEISLFFLKA